MTTQTLYQSLQGKLGSYVGEHLTPAIRYQDRNGNLVEKALMDATLDDIAFAIQALGAESAAIHRRRNALDSLYSLAREHGSVGSDLVGDIAAEVTK